MHIALLTASASRLGGGVASAVHAQAEMIRGAGGRATVIALEDEFSPADRALLGAGELLTAPVIGPRAIGFAPALAGLLRRASPDMVHLHGIWMYPSRAGARWAARTGKPYLISPHGMLDPWITARGRWKKALARAGYERASWRRATAFHALTADEAADIRRQAGRSEIRVIPNAGPATISQGRGTRRPLVVYLGRIHPKKNLPALVAAWRAARRPENAELAIAGWGDARDVAALEALLAEAGDGSIRFLGPVHGEAKARLLADARFLVLPSHSEGLPMTVLEAWAAGTPTIMTPACHLPEGFAAGAAIECTPATTSVREALERALALDEGAWRAMSVAALGLAGGPFSAPTIARRWNEVYRALAAGSGG
ncbi:MAG: glycosyltransferase [Croceibacterium sp.]